MLTFCKQGQHVIAAVSNSNWSKTVAPKALRVKAVCGS
jgi:hypothetical protein